MAPKPKHVVKTGDIFGRWVVGEDSEYRGKNVYYKCSCSCGNIKYVSKYSLTSGRSVSCGCHRKEVARERFTTHGLSNKSIYHSYKDMVKRCHQEGAMGWEEYGAKGITVCERWLESFENFAADMYESWFDGATIERIDFEKCYSPENTRWVTKKEQAFNTGMRKTNRSGFKGVALSSDGVYIATWTDFLTGKQYTKGFSSSKYGEELAFFLAKEYRLKQVELQNANGACYTDKHIGSYKGETN